MSSQRKAVSGSIEESSSGEDVPENVKSCLVIDEQWNTAYKSSLKNVEDLSQFFSFKEEEKTRLKQVARIFHMRIPQYYFSLIQDMHDETDPIRKQSVPSGDEIREGLHDSIDPLGEEKTSPHPCLVHRYPDRVLLLVTGRCFMYCRHCTRKRLWKGKNFEPTLKEIDAALGYVKENKQIREVVISGGDPFTLPTERLEYILSAVSQIEHIEVMRIGTRAPVVMPQRVDEELAEVLGKYEKLWINVQFNHPREITAQSTAACKKIQKRGIPVSNQSVLLKGVNDDPETMKELCQKLQSIRIRPYYLFQCDPVVGAEHFRTSVWRGVEIIEKLRGHTSGMCIPTFVVDGVDGKGKIPLGPNYVVSMAPDGVTLRNYNFEVFSYHNPKE